MKSGLCILLVTGIVSDVVNYTNSTVVFCNKLVILISANHKS